MNKDKLPKECRLCNSKDLIIKDYKKNKDVKVYLSTCQICRHEDLIITREISPS